MRFSKGRRPGAVSAFAAIVVATLLSGCSDPMDPPLVLPELSPEAAQWIGSRVFDNECAGRRECLVHWNDGEAFPSLGIGHFIWYPEGVDGPFKESFPLMIQSLTRKGVTLPSLLHGLKPFDAPWQNKSEFSEQRNSPEVMELRNFLWATRGEQTDFLIKRASAALKRIVDHAPPDYQPQVTERIQALLETAGGVYALIDYINFKGEGLVVTERYQGQGWGLLQVLLTMPDADDVPVIDRFRRAARAVLIRRAENEATGKERQQWLPGWLARVETYREP